MHSEGFQWVFSQQSIPSALMMSLLSVGMLVGLFYYLNRYTQRQYFSIWTVAWMFYALWLLLNLELPDAAPAGMVFMFKQWCVAISAVFLLWGSLRFLSIPVRQTLFLLFMLFLLAWTSVAPQMLSDNTLAVRLPVFVLLGIGSVFAGGCFFRLRRKMPFVGAGMLSLGFLLWGLYLAGYPLSQEYKDFSAAGYFIATVLQIFIAVSMIVLVLEEARYNAERMHTEIAAIRSEKEALQFKALSAEEQCRNLYDQVRLTEGLQKAYEELRRLQPVVVQQERLRALGQMASGIAHDINNALSPILAYSELLLTTSPDLPEKTRQFVQNIHKSGGDVARIVARMREFYRRRSDSEPLTKVNINQIVEEVIDLTRPRWRDVSQRDGTSIHVRHELEPDLPRLLSDPSDLREALINLVFNAVDALPYGGTITLTTRSVNCPASETRRYGERRLQIEVSDDGMGMDEKTRQHCLEPFFSTKAQRGGTGLGLAMVYGMMQRHEGTMDIQSFPGRGTSIRLTFPLRETVSAAQTADADLHKQNRALRILCIDDEHQIRRLLSDCLAPFDHQVTLASCGTEGLDLFRKARSKNNPFEVVITDLGMPDIDGHQVAKSVKAESPGTPVIMMTGWGTIMRQDNQKTPEIDALVDKPPRIKELNELLLRLTAKS